MKQNYNFKSIFFSIIALISWQQILFFHTENDNMFVATGAFLFVFGGLIITKVFGERLDKKLDEELEYASEIEETTDEKDDEDDDSFLLKANVPSGSLITIAVIAIGFCIICCSLAIPGFDLFGYKIQIGQYSFFKDDLVQWLLPFIIVPLINELVSDMSVFDGEGIYTAVFSLISLEVLSFLFTFKSNPELILITTVVELFTYLLGIRKYIYPNCKKMGYIAAVIGTFFCLVLFCLHIIPYGSLQDFLVAGPVEQESFQYILRDNTYNITYLILIFIFLVSSFVVILSKTKEDNYYLTSITCYMILAVKTLGLFSVFKIFNINIYPPFSKDAILDSVLLAFIMFNQFEDEVDNEDDDWIQPCIDNMI